jgi:hypothetical protein
MTLRMVEGVLAAHDVWPTLQTPLAGCHCEGRVFCGPKDLNRTLSESEASNLLFS